MTEGGEKTAGRQLENGFWPNHDFGKPIRAFSAGFPCTIW
jgi:hypothetical protein